MYYLLILADLLLDHALQIGSGLMYRTLSIQKKYYIMSEMSASGLINISTYQLMVYQPHFSYLLSTILFKLGNRMQEKVQCFD